MDRPGGRSFRALLVALGIDNFGSGLFLPITMLYLVRVVGTDVGAAGILVAAGSIVGLAAPALASRVVDSAGPKLLVIGSQGIQAIGMAAFLWPKVRCWRPQGWSSRPQVYSSSIAQ